MLSLILGSGFTMAALGPLLMLPFIRSRFEADAAGLRQKAPTRWSLAWPDVAFAGMADNGFGGQVLMLRDAAGRRHQANVNAEDVAPLRALAAAYGVQLSGEEGGEELVVSAVPLSARLFYALWLVPALLLGIPTAILAVGGGRLPPLLVAIVVPLVVLPVAVVHLIARRWRVRVTADERGLSTQLVRPRGSRPLTGMPWAEIASLRTGVQGRWAYLALRRRSATTLGRLTIEPGTRAAFEQLAEAHGVPVERVDARAR